MSSLHASFACWDRLPTELQLAVLECLLTGTQPLLRVRSLTSIVEDELSNIISTRNHHLINLAMEACEYPPTLRRCSFWYQPSGHTERQSR